MNAVLLISHGSRYESTLNEIRSIAQALKEQSQIPIFEYAFLDIEKPSIPDGIDICVEKGASSILILLNFLNAGQHVDHDIPGIVEEARSKHPGVPMRLTLPLGQQPGIIKFFLNIMRSSQ
jgi:sirohydrochlorin ferrochelatase